MISHPTEQSHDLSEFPIGAIVNPEEYSFRLKITGLGVKEIFAEVIKAEYLYPSAQVQPFQVGQVLRFVPGIVMDDGTSMWNLDFRNWWFTLSKRDGRLWFEHYR